MTERKYSVTEIDDMRKQVRRLFTPMDQVEEVLRTYMQGGIEPADLTARADRRWTEIGNEYKAREARRRETQTTRVEIISAVRVELRLRGWLRMFVKSMTLCYGRN